MSSGLDEDPVYRQLNAAAHAFADRRRVGMLEVFAHRAEPDGPITCEFLGLTEDGGPDRGTITDPFLFKALLDQMKAQPAIGQVRVEIADSYRGGVAASDLEKRIGISYRGFEGPTTELASRLPIDGRVRVRGDLHTSVSAAAMDALVSRLGQITTAANHDLDVSAARAWTGLVMTAIGASYRYLGGPHDDSVADAVLVDSLRMLGVYAEPRVVDLAPAGVAIAAMPRNAPLVKAVLDTLAPHIQATEFRLETASGPFLVTVAKGVATMRAESPSKKSPLRVTG